MRAELLNTEVVGFSMQFSLLYALLLRNMADDETLQRKNKTMLRFFIFMRSFSLGLCIGCCINIFLRPEFRLSWAADAVLFAICAVIGEYGKRLHQND
jgi:hypothetical protein